MTVISFLCFLLLIFIFTSQANTIRTKQNFHHICVGGNYTTNSTYQTNLNTLLSNLTSNTEIDYGFYNSSYGENSDRVNAIGMCRGDIVNLNACRSCLSGSIANLTQLCPNRKEAIGWYANEICMLRYSNRSIFGLSEIEPAYYQWNLRNANRDEFNKEVKKLVDSLKNKAASGDSRRKYDAASAIGPNDQTIYGLVQCTPDLSAQQCDDCLAESITEIPNCCNNAIGARILRPSCILRYQTNSLFHEPSTTDSPSPSTLPASPSTPFAQNTSSQGKSNNTATGIGIAIAVSVVVAIMVLIFICIYLKVRKSTKKFETQEEDDKDDEIEISESLQFKFNTIQSATNDFSDSNKLGQGGFGAVYRGSLSNGQEIAVKRLSRDSGQGDLEFKNEVLLVAKLQHRNLVRLLGFCLEGRERLLVYEFVPNKSLDNFIFDQTKRAQLNWEMRYKIIADIARGILYLHEDSRLRIIHRDLKASNILLDEKMHPKIADFGMARLFGVDQTQENTNRIVGTYGYMAPEYAMHGQFSVKSDVFSFGILVLEIISGHKNSVIRRGENIEYLPSFAWRNWREGSATNIIDPTLNNGSLNEVLRCIHIGLLCVQENVASRPTMASVVVMLNSHSVTLPIPSEPAFYLDSRSGSLLDMQSWGANSAQDQSVNEASITELYPR